MKYTVWCQILKIYYLCLNNTEISERNNAEIVDSEHDFTVLISAQFLDATTLVKIKRFFFFFKYLSEISSLIVTIVNEITCSVELRFC